MTPQPRYHTIMESRIISHHSETILHIAPTPFFANRGCHIRIRNEVEALQKMGWRCIVCTYHHGNDVPGIDIRRISGIPGYNQTTAGYSPFKFLADILLFFRVLQIIRKERPSILHGHLHEGALIAWAAARWFAGRNMQVVMDMQGSLSGELEAYQAFRNPMVLFFFRSLERWIDRLPDKIVCSSVETRHMAIDRFEVPEDRIIWLGDVVPDWFFRQSPLCDAVPAGVIPSGRFVVIYAGSLLPAKGVDRVLDVIRRMTAYRDRIYFVLIGYPEDPVRRFVEEHRLEDICLVPGEVPYDRLAGWLQAADLGIDPKWSDSGEASGKLMHYMASGLPVVCFDLPFNRSLAAESAYYVDPGRRPQEEAMVEAVLEAMKDEEGRIEKGRCARERAKELFSSEALGARLLGVYHLG